MSLYRPTDIELASQRFSASCGHAALAAILGREVCEVREAACQVFQGRGYVSAPMMENALAALRPGNWRPGIASGREFPARGLVLVQLQGPWMEPGLPLGAQLARTHWVAVDGPRRADAWVYDINADGWIRRSTWEELILPQILEFHKRATGWYVRRCYEVQPVLLSVNQEMP